MYCGAKMKLLENATVADLLECIPDNMLNAKIKVTSNNKFYVHFDIDGEYINLHVKACTPDYGSVSAKSCSACGKYKGNKCTCTGEGCVNFSGLLESTKSVLEDKKSRLNNQNIVMQQMKEEYISDDTGPVAPIPVTEKRDPVNVDPMEEIVKDCIPTLSEECTNCIDTSTCKNSDTTIKIESEEDEPIAVNGVPYMDIPQFIQDYNKSRSGKKKQAKFIQPEDNDTAEDVVPVVTESKKIIEPSSKDNALSKTIESALKDALKKMLKALD